MKTHLVVDVWPTTDSQKAICGQRNPVSSSSRLEGFQALLARDQCVRCLTVIAMHPGRFE